MGGVCQGLILWDEKFKNSLIYDIVINRWKGAVFSYAIACDVGIDFIELDDDNCTGM